MKAWIALAAAVACAQTTPEFFGSSVYPVLEAAQCRVCHTQHGVASATRLHFPEKEATPAQIQAFGYSLAGLGTLLLDKPTERVAHTGGRRIAPGSDQERLLRQWTEHVASNPAPAAARTEAAAAPGQLVRRLTHSQYDNTVRDLLGDHSRPAQRFPAEDYVDGFKNQLRHQAMPPLLVETYSTSAERLARNAFRAGDINGLIPCKPVSAGDAACRDRFVREFGRRAFRRPLLDAEMKRYSAAFAAEAKSGGSFLEGARAVVEAMLQSPKFLFHIEEGPGGKAADFAIASRLSYLLWDTMPDQALFDAAARGELRTAEGRERAARRMIASPRTAEALDEFFNQWLRFDRVLNASKERRRFPEWAPELAAAMVEETRRLLQHLVAGDRNFMELFTAEYGFLSSDLAALYQLPAPPGQFEMVRFPQGTRRAGILGHGSVLAATAGPMETSPTARGIFVREQLLCQHVPPPPPNVNTALADPTEEKPQTRRQRLNEHVANPGCAACHKLMDPIGFGLEHFDAIGRWRDKETILIAGEGEGNRARQKRFDLALEVGGDIAGLPGSAFSDARQLGAILAASPACQDCIVRQTFRYAHGRMETSADRAAVESLAAAFRGSGFRFRELLVALAKSPEIVRGLDHNRSQ